MIGVTAYLLAATAVLGAVLSQPVRYITGIVHDPSGRPVSGITVTADSDVGAKPAVTDSNGSFSLVLTQDVAPGDSVSIRMRDLRDRFDVHTWSVTVAHLPQAVRFELTRLAPPKAPPPSASVPRTPVFRYQRAPLVENVLNGKLDAVPYQERYSKTYLARMAQHLSKSCRGQHFTARDAESLTRQAALSTFDLSSAEGSKVRVYKTFVNTMSDAPVPPLDVSRTAGNLSALPAEAAEDAASLIRRYGCGSAELETFSRHARTYVTAPRLTADALLPLCASAKAPASLPTHRGQSSCVCLLSLFVDIPLTRSDREALATDFWSGARSLMKENEARFGLCGTDTR